MQIDAFEGFEGREVVITEKMDGENTTLYPDSYTHARSTGSKYHESRSWIKNDWASKAYRLAPNLRIVGENMYARHSIAYNELESFFYGYGVYRGNICLGWDETVDLIEDFGYPVPQVFYRGEWDMSKAYEWSSYLHDVNTDSIEGYVVRIVDEFTIDKFHLHVAKSVRENHVKSDQHWMYTRMIVNRLKEEENGT